MNGGLIHTIVTDGKRNVVAARSSAQSQKRKGEKKLVYNCTFTALQVGILESYMSLSTNKADHYHEEEPSTFTTSFRLHTTNM